MRVLCMNDKALPEGAEVVAGKDYRVSESFVNNWGQRVFLIEGVRNEGTTRNGLMWHGYAANRFAVLDKSPLMSMEVEEAELAGLN